jgi:hypothetical protein
MPWPWSDQSPWQDRWQLQEALANLADNALEHGRGTVRLVSRVDGDCLVRDVAPRAVNAQPSAPGRKVEPTAPSPREVLDLRLARGDIGPEEYSTARPLLDQQTPPRVSCSRHLGLPPSSRSAGRQPRLIVSHDSHVVWKIRPVMMSPMIGSAIGTPRAMKAVLTMIPPLR